MPFDQSRVKPSILLISNIAIMKVLAFVAVATLLVVGTKSDSATEANRDVWGQECRQETGFGLLAPGTRLADPLQTAEARRYAECYFTKAGFMKNGALVERKKACDIIDNEIQRNGRYEPTEGRTVRQLVEKCYDEANAKTDRYEIAGALMTCITQRVRRKV